MSSINFDLTAPIIPSVGLANLRISQSYREILDELENVDKKKRFAFDKSKSVFIMWDCEDKIIQINALKGYKGALNIGREIKIGNKINILVENGWYFDETVDGFIKDNVSGVLIQTDLEDATSEEIELNIGKLLVSEIIVSNLD